MSAIQVTAERHTLIRKGRASFHAAVPTDAGWRTACGESLVSELHRTINAFEGDEGRSLLAKLASDSPQLLCKRCDRVGSVLL